MTSPPVIVLVVVVVWQNLKVRNAPEPPVADLQRVNVGRYLLKAGHAVETGVS